MILLLEYLRCLQVHGQITALRVSQAIESISRRHGRNGEFSKHSEAKCLNSTIVITTNTISVIALTLTFAITHFEHILHAHTYHIPQTSDAAAKSCKLKTNSDITIHSFQINPNPNEKCLLHSR
jgi:hypothetical protein